jgi:hypothetical protein
LSRAIPLPYKAILSKEEAVLSVSYPPHNDKTATAENNKFR